MRRGLTMRAAWLWPMLAALLLTAMPAAAQERFAAVTGVVRDASGAVLPGVTVSITNKQTGKVYTVVTGSDGVYRVLDLEPGRYSVRFELAGLHAGGDAGRRTLLLGKTLELTPTLTVGGLSEAVTVDGGVAAHRHQEHDDRAQRDGRGVRPHPEGPQLPEHRHLVAVGQRGRDRRRHPGQRRQRRRELVHGRRRRRPTASSTAGRARTRSSSTCRKCRSRPAASAPSTAARSAASSARSPSRAATRSTARATTTTRAARLSAAPVKRLVLDPLDDAPCSYVQDVEAADRPPRGRRIARRPDRQGQAVLLRVGGAAVPAPDEPTTTSPTDETDTHRRRSRRSTARSARSPTTRRAASTASFSVLWTPTTSTGTLPAYDGVGRRTQIASIARGEPDPEDPRIRVSRRPATPARSTSR